MPTTQSSRPGWRARLVRMGYWRAIALITMFSIAASVLATGLLSVLLGLREKFELGLLIAAVVPIFVAPLASHLFLRVLFELQDARAALLDLATRDSLTQVYNRRYFMGRFASEAARARRTGEALSLLMIDADEFKPINDRYGHAAGDRTLQEIARVCRETLRPDDVIARYGGEEFVALMPGISLQQACGVAERLRAAVALLRIESTGGDFIGVTVSLGVGALTSADARHEMLLDRADAALYEAKRGGRNRWALESARAAG